MKKLLFSLTTIFLLFHSLTLPLSARAADCAQDYKKYFFPDAGSCSTYQAACNPAGPFYEKFGNDEESCLSAFGIANLTFQSPTGGSKWYMQTPQEFSRKVLDPSNNEIFGERYTFAQINWIINSLLTMLNPTAGAQKPEDIVNLVIQLSSSITPNSNSQGSVPYLPPSVANFSVFPYSHPVSSGVGELKKIVNFINPATTVNAQGVGQQKLDTSNNIRNLWTATRNIAYIVTAILLVASGFLVMFRTQVAPQTVVTIQLIIPKLVASLILITFSYAIVGFVIDMIYVTIAALLGLLNTANPNLFNPGVGGLQTSIEILTGGNFSFVGYFLWLPVSLALMCLIFLFLLTPIFTNPIISAGLALSGGGLAAIIGFSLLPLAFGLVAWSIYVTARIIGQLLLAYLNLIILTITGPLQIMMDVLPTKKDVGFKSWIMCVIGNSSVFVTYIMFALIGAVLFRFDAGNRLFFFVNGEIPPGLGLRPDIGIDSSFSLPGANFNLNFARPNDLTTFIWWIFLGMGYFTAVPDMVHKIKSLFCKEDDYSKFIENLVKDTIGQISKAGQESGGKLGKELGERDRPTAPESADETIGA